MNLRYFLIVSLCLSSLAAAPVDLPTRTAAQNQAEQQPPTIQVLVLLNHFLKSISSHDTSQAYFAFTSRDFRDNVKLDDFKNFLLRFPALSRNSSVQHIKEEYYDKSAGEPAAPGDVAVIESLVESFDGQKNTAKFVLVFEGGQWRVRSIEVLPAPIQER